MFGAASPAWGNSPAPRYWERAGQESNVGEFVSIGAPLSQHDTATRAGDCLRVWRIDGVAFASAEFNLIQDRHDAWCNVLRNLTTGRTAVYHHRIHRRIHDRLVALTVQRHQLLASDDAVLTQIEAMDVALSPNGRAGGQRNLNRHGASAAAGRGQLIALGTPITERAPHRSEHAQFTHSAPTLGV